VYSSAKELCFFFQGIVDWVFTQFYDRFQDFRVSATCKL
jgi:hypothetical protein